jgi:DNA-binding LacI/PurR family transcriptional regulator
MQRILDGARGAPPTAVFVHNDQMALGAVHALRDLGLGVPEDVSVVGFDDVPEAAHYAPPLTTIRQDFATLGVESVDYLVRRMADRDAPVHQRVIKPSLQVRASTRRLDAS